ncbi:hypothetical protein ACIGO9_06030 [Nocardia asteroides]|uniref:hypothetical protein n=1 Tax=Nocardia asteroides TaxID=1824 RepID=UPI0037CC845A
MTVLTRTLRIGIATLAATTGLLLTAGPAAAETTGSSSLGTGSAHDLLDAFACAVGAKSCPIVIPQ